MEAQEVFDQVAKHLLAQKVRAREDCYVGTAGPGCRYRTKDGLKCAAGALLNDEEYGEWMEGHGFYCVLLHPSCPASIRERLEPHRNLIEHLQGVHDGVKPEEWLNALKGLAIHFTLKFEEP